MITLCWAAKGGSGTTVAVATRALATNAPTLLVDLAGDLPAVFGVADTDRPGVLDWLGSDASPERLRDLEIDVDGRCAILPAGSTRASGAARFDELAARLDSDVRDVVIDAGTGVPPQALVTAADRRWIVTRACYLALRAALRQKLQPTGVILVAEPGRALRVEAIEATLGAPIVAHVLHDPAVARAVDAGLLVARLPGGFRRRLAAAA